ncbi:MAG: hypothetical protein HeimC3_24160 [Candidatus Heimdallarchaeota archaeon LC_3]|nr:MAG: hypothetical protein HeimC3_24160 [Candidatus Heimdallarchaeota archaeon LC_3]
MKTWKITTIIVIGSFLLISNTSTAGNSPQFFPFQLQDCGNFSGKLFTSEDPKTVIIEINVTNHTNDIFLHYSEHMYIKYAPTLF